MKKEFTFKSKTGEKKMAEPIKGNKASKIVFDVLQKGNLPDGLKLQWAESYKGHFIKAKNKNACGASDIKNLLVVTGIATELEKAGVKGICQPTKKPYKAIKLGDWKDNELKELADKIARVLGFKETPVTQKPVAKKKASPKKKVAATA